MLQFKLKGEKKILFPGGDSGKTIFVQTRVVDGVNQGMRGWGDSSGTDGASRPSWT